MRSLRREWKYRFRILFREDVRQITNHNYLYDERFGTLRFFKNEGGYDFVAADVANIFGYKNSNHAMQTKVNKEDKTIRYVKTNGGK